MEHPRAVCFLLVRDDGLILAVSRKHDLTAFGLPGGKVDPGEDPKTSVAREVREETASSNYHGFVVTDPELMFEGICVGDVIYDSSTYWSAISPNQYEIPQTPYVNNEGAIVDFVTPSVLMAGPFGEYNRALFEKVGIKVK